MGIVFGVSSFGQITPKMKSIVDGNKIAGKFVYDIIDRVDKILLDDPKVLKKPKD
jgi:hypothetical protein